MINHARTLMINAQLPNNSMYGSEYIDPTFRPLQLSTRGRLIRETLFGSDPDELTLNFRAAQYLNLLYSNDTIKKYLDKLDRRNTYRDDVWLGFDFSSKIHFTESSILKDYLSLIGLYLGQDAFGQNLMNFNIEFNAAVVPAKVTFTYRNHKLPPRVIQLMDLDLFPDQIISNPDLPGLLFSFVNLPDLVTSVLNENAEARSEPERTLGDIATTLINAGALNMDFNIDSGLLAELRLMSKFRSTSLVALSSILLAYIYENEGIRLNG